MNIQYNNTLTDNDSACLKSQDGPAIGAHELDITLPTGVHRYRIVACKNAFGLLGLYGESRTFGFKFEAMYNEREMQETLPDSGAFWQKVAKEVAQSFAAAAKT